ncbi:MAG: cysteine hydrolase [Bacteroidota bacterium]
MKQIRPVLLVIDIQNWFFNIAAFDSAESQQEIQSLLTSTNELIRFFQTKQLPIIHIMTVFKADGSTRDQWSKDNDYWVLVEGTEEAKERAEILRFETDIEIIKTRCSAYLNTDLDKTLQTLQADTVVIAGYSTNKCIGMAAIQSAERDLDVWVSSDAIMGRNQHRSDAMLHVMEHEFKIEPIQNQEIMKRLELRHTLQ